VKQALGARVVKGEGLFGGAIRLKEYQFMEAMPLVDSPWN
jgi:hypothetical protein